MFSFCSESTYIDLAINKVIPTQSPPLNWMTTRCFYCTEYNKKSIKGGVFAWNLGTFDDTLEDEKLFLYSVNVFLKPKSPASNIKLRIFTQQSGPLKKISKLTTLPAEHKHFHMSYPATEINKHDTLCEIDCPDSENWCEYLSIYFDVQIKSADGTISA